MNFKVIWVYWSGWNIKFYREVFVDGGRKFVLEDIIFCRENFIEIIKNFYGKRERIIYSFRGVVRVIVYILK